MTSPPTFPPDHDARPFDAVAAGDPGAPATGVAVHARGLVKRFGDFTAVDGIDLEVAEGETFAFLGANGAGKTSAMRMIATVSPVTEGDLVVLGMDPQRDGQAIRSRLGWCPRRTTSTSS